MSVKIIFNNSYYPAQILDTHEFNYGLKFDKLFKTLNNWKYIPSDAKLNGQ